MTLSEIVLSLIPIVITALLGWITPYVVKWLNARFSSEVVQALTNVAYSAVQAAEQRAGSITNSEKRAFAEAALKSFASDRNYKVSETDVEVLIEAAVHQFKNGFGSLLSSNEFGAGNTINAVPVVQVPVSVTETPDEVDTLPVTGESEVSVAEVITPAEEVEPDTDPVLETQEPSENPAVTTISKA